MIPKEFDFKTYRELKEEIFPMISTNDLVVESLVDSSVFMTFATMVEEELVLKWDKFVDFHYKGDGIENFVNGEVPSCGICKRVKKDSSGDLHLELQTESFYHKENPDEPINKVVIIFSKYRRYEPNIPYKVISEQ